MLYKEVYKNEFYSQVIALSFFSVISTYDDTKKRKVFLKFGTGNKWNFLQVGPTWLSLISNKRRTKTSIGYAIEKDKEKREGEIEEERETQRERERDKGEGYREKVKGRGIDSDRVKGRR